MPFHRYQMLNNVPLDVHLSLLVIQENEKHHIKNGLDKEFAEMDLVTKQFTFQTRNEINKNFGGFKSP